MNQVRIDAVRLDIHVSQAGALVTSFTDVLDVTWTEPLNEAGEWSCTIPSERFDPTQIKLKRFVKLYDASANPSTTADADMLFAGPIEEVGTEWRLDPSARVSLSGATALGLLLDDEQDGLIATRSWETPDYVSLVNLRYKLNQAVPEFIDDDPNTWVNIDLDFDDKEGVDGNGYTHVSRILVAHETPFNKFRLYVRGLNEGGTWPYFPQPQTPRGLRVELIDGSAWAEYETTDTTQANAYQPFSKQGWGEISWTPLSLPAQSADEASGATGYIVRIRSIHPDNDSLEEPEGGTGRFGANRLQVYIAVPDVNEFQSAVTDYCPGFTLSAGSPAGSGDGTLWQFYAETSLAILQELSRRTGYNFVLEGANKIKWFQGHPLSAVITQTEQGDLSSAPSPNIFYLTRSRRIAGRRPLVTRVTVYGAGSDDGAKVDISKFDASDVTLPSGFTVAGGQVINQTAETDAGYTKHRVVDFPEIGGVDGGAGTTRQLSAELVKAAVAWLMMNSADSVHWELAGYNLKAGTHPGQKITVAGLAIADTAGNTTEAINEQMVITSIRHRLEADGLRFYDLEVSNTGAFPPHDWRLLTEMARESRQRRRYPQPSSQNKLVAGNLSSKAGTASGSGASGETADAVQDNLDAHVAETAGAHNIPAQIDAKVATHAGETNVHNIPGQIAAHAADEDAHHGRVHDLGGGDHTGQLPWDDLSKTGANLTDLPTRAHSSLQNITPADHHNPATSGAGVAVSGGQQVSLSPGTLSSTSANSAPTGGTHTHAVTASAAPSTSELLKADGSGGIELDHLTVTNDVDVYGQFLQAVDGTNYFRHAGIATYRSASASLGPYVAIETTIGDTPVSAEQFMLALRVAVYQYGTNKPPAYVDIAFYNYQTNNKLWMSHESTSRSIAGVQLARNVATGKTAVLIQMSATVDYPLVIVDAVNQFRAAGSYFAGWSVAMKANTADYSNLQTVPDVTGLKPSQLLAGTAGAEITWSSDQHFNGNIDANGNLDLAGTADLHGRVNLRGSSDIAAEGDLPITANGNVTIDAGLGDILTPSQLSADNWISGVTAWGITPAGAGDFRILTADELRVEVFVSEIQRALAGEQIIGKSLAILAADFTPNQVVDGTATLTVYDLPNAPDAQVFAPGDYIGIKYVVTSGGGLTVGEAIGTVSNYADLADGLQSWTFTTKVAIPVAVTIKQEAVAVDYGVSGDGIWRVSALDPSGAPHASVETWTGLPNNRTVQTRLGNLDGIAGQSGYGLFAGNPAGEFIRINESGLVVAGDGAGLTDIQGGQVVVTGGGDLNSALGDLANEDSALAQALAALSSRGEQLVTNGDGSLGDNTNFSQFTFEGADVPPGLPGAFREASYQVTRLADEFIAVNPNLAYRLSFLVKGDPAVGQRMYLGLEAVDIDLLSITPQMWTVKDGTQTTLAQDYTPGDAIMYLSSGTGWDTTNVGTTTTGYAYPRFGNYQNSNGYDYGDYGYSRMFIQANGPNSGQGLPYTLVNGNELHFNSGARGYDPGKPGAPSGTWPAGTPVCMGWPGGTYLYTAAANVVTPSAWEEYSGILEGLSDPTTISGGNYSFPPGAAFVRPVMLLNRTTAGGQTLISGVRLAVDVETAREAVLNWAQNGDITLINGGTIATNTILADSIAANTITGEEIAFDTLTGGHIMAEEIDTVHFRSDSVTSRVVAAGAVTAEKLAVGLLSPNLILNPTFDVDATDWELSGTTARATSEAQAGAGSLALFANGDGAISHKARVAPGQTYVLTFYAKGVGALDTLAVRANFQNSVTPDNYISLGDADSSTTLLGSEAPSATWEQKRAVFVAPAGHEWLSVEITASISGFDGIYVDTFELMPLLAGTVIKDGTILTQNLAADAIDGMTITGNLIDGATVQGSTIYGGENAGGYTVKIDLDGIEMETTQVPANPWPFGEDGFTADPEYKLRFGGGMTQWAVEAGANTEGDTFINAIELGTGQGLAIGRGISVDGYWSDLSHYAHRVNMIGNGIIISARMGVGSTGTLYGVGLVANGSVRVDVNSSRTLINTLYTGNGGLRLNDYLSDSFGGLHLAGHSFSNASIAGDTDNPSNTITGKELIDDAPAPTKWVASGTHWRLYMYGGALKIVFDDGQRVTLARNDGGEQTPTLVNDWGDLSGFKGAHYWREGDTVHLGGAITNATAVADGETIMTLPVGFRPSAGLIFSARAFVSGSQTVARIDVYGNGTVKWLGGAVASVSSLSLSGISFRAA